jgi:hypothetical protein
MKRRHCPWCASASVEPPGPGGPSVEQYWWRCSACGHIWLGAAATSPRAGDGFGRAMAESGLGYARPYDDPARPSQVVSPVSPFGSLTLLEGDSMMRPWCPLLNG